MTHLTIIIPSVSLEIFITPEADPSNIEGQTSAASAEVRSLSIAVAIFTLDQQMKHWRFYLQNL